ncbi:MAG: hypothetical protein Q8R82_02140 [Hyphomonadaceae bacterium]|nr:hypothetical protein [Hyphomonadaceae bacterium]
MIGETELEMVQRHVREGAAHVIRQTELVAKLELDGHDATAAQSLLSTFEEMQAEHLAHLDRIRGRVEIQTETPPIDGTFSDDTRFAK